MREEEQLSDLQNDHHQKEVNGEYCEKDYQDAIEAVLDENDVEYNREVVIQTPTNITSSKGKGNRGRRCDFYIPQTDTVIECKIEANLRGIGQAFYYRQFHRETILMAESIRNDIHHCCLTIPGVIAAETTPVVRNNETAGLSLKTDGRSEFEHQARHGTLGSGNDWLSKSPWKIEQRRMTDYEDHGSH